MSRLEIFDEAGHRSGEPVTDHAAIGAALGALGVRFEAWSADRPLSPEANQEEVLAAYREPVDALNAEYGFQSVDVVSLRPGHPQAAELREKFLAEHVHADFEVRFFVDGKGLFYLHVNDVVYLVLCEAGDLISVPAGTTHWFDMGEAPDFKCIRFFTVADGWVADFTGSGIAARFPSYDRFLEAAA
ncbi:1,2-dihydroxy-3-keto-5-methylthiopentene dioxygenase [Endothiovibrio diazotrophicus]